MRLQYGGKIVTEIDFKLLKFNFVLLELDRFAPSRNGPRYPMIS